MNANPGYGFVPSPDSPKKKQFTPAPNSTPVVLNNYVTIAVDLHAVLLVALLVVIVYGLMRLASSGLQA
jgi:hypothetical protein